MDVLPQAVDLLCFIINKKAVRKSGKVVYFLQDYSDENAAGY